MGKIVRAELPRGLDISGGQQSHFPSMGGLVEGMRSLAGSLRRVERKQAQTRANSEQMLRVAQKTEGRMALDNARQDYHQGMVTNEQGPAAHGSLDRVREWQDKPLEGVLQKYEDPEVQAYLTQYWAGQVNHVSNKAIEWENRNLKNYMLQVGKTFEDHTVGMIGQVQPGDTAALDQLTQVVMENYREIAPTYGKDAPAYIMAQRQEVVDRMYSEAFVGWLNGDDPYGAIQAFDASYGTMQGKVSPAVISQLQAAVARKRPMAEATEIIDSLRGEYGQDYSAMIKEVIESDVYDTRFGEDLAVRNLVQTQLSTLRNMQKAQIQEDQKEERKTISDIMSQSLREGDMDSFLQEIDNAPSHMYDAVDKMKMRSAVANNGFQANTEAVQGLYDDINDGNVTEDAQIFSRLGNGIGRDVGPYLSYLKTYTDQAEKNRKAGLKGKQNFFKQSLEMFKSQSQLEDDLYERGNVKSLTFPMTKYPRYEQRLRIKLQMEGVPFNSPAVLDAAEELLKVDYYRTPDKMQRMGTDPIPFYGQHSSDWWGRNANRYAPVFEREGQTAEDWAQFNEMSKDHNNIPGSTPEEKADFFVNAASGFGKKVDRDAVIKMIEGDTDGGSE